MFYNNVRGMTSKKDKILISSTSCDYDMIVLTETWLNSNKFSAEFFDPRFTVYRKDRCDSNINAIQGGGVLIAIDSKYDSEIVTLPEIEHIEAVCIKIHLRSSNTHMFVFSLYIQCHSPESVYSSHLSTLQHIHS